MALRLARLRPKQVAAIAVLAAPLRLRASEVRAIGVLANLPKALRFGVLADINIPKFAGFDVSDEDSKRRNPALPALPVSAVASMIELAAVVRRDLPYVKIPTLVAHGEKDRTVPLEDSFELVGSLGAEVVERLWLPRSGHLIGIDVERSVLIEALGKLFAAHIGGGTRP